VRGHDVEPMGAVFADPDHLPQPQGQCRSSGSITRSMRGRLAGSARWVTWPRVSPPQAAGIRTTGEGPELKRSRFNEERIIEILREHEAGAAVAEVCRRHGMSSATFYAWRAAGVHHHRGGSEQCPLSRQASRRCRG
jgi:hypothetical protein